jgi:hypothetical protein
MLVNYNTAGINFQNCHPGQKFMSRPSPRPHAAHEAGRVLKALTDTLDRAEGSDIKTGIGMSADQKKIRRAWILGALACRWGLNAC